MFKVGSIFIPVTDLEKAETWYETTLKAKVIDRWEDGIGLYLTYGSTQIALIKVETIQPSEFNTFGDQMNGYFNFAVQDIHVAYEHFKNLNVKLSNIEDFGGMQCFDFFDLEGNPFSVVNEMVGSPFHSESVERAQRES